MQLREKEKELYEKLVDKLPGLLGAGRHNIEDIYEIVATTDPNLCDDELMCFECCEQGHNQPEWKHRVRGALDSLKKQNFVLKDG